MRNWVVVLKLKKVREKNEKIQLSLEFRVLKKQADSLARIFLDLLLSHYLCLIFLIFKKKQYIFTNGIFSRALPTSIFRAVRDSSDKSGTNKTHIPPDWRRR